MCLAPAAIGLHQDEEPTPRFIAASPPDVSESGQRANEEGKNTHLIGAQRAQNSGTDPELAFSTSGNDSEHRPYS